MDDEIKRDKETMPSDEQLVEGFLAGDIEAFNLLVRKWQRPIYNFVYRFTGEREDAQDICQEVFTIVFRKLKELKEKNKFSSWIYKIALNQCRIKKRQERGKTSISLDAPMEGEEGATSLEIATGEQENPEYILQQKEVAELLKKALARIPEEQRAVIVMKEYEGLKFTEIAEILNCPVGTVKSRTYFGLKALEKEVRRLVKLSRPPS